MPTTPVVAALLLSLRAVLADEYALVNIIRHGERTDDATNPHLAPLGQDRAEYIAKCASQSTPSLAFPLGPPTHMLASLRPGKSVRPYETLEPLAKKLDMHLGNDVHMADTVRFEEYLHELPAGATAFISWQHWWITWLLKTVYPNAGAYPNFCPYSEWVDLPEFTHGRCYDILYQLTLRRSGPNELWHVTAFTMMNMGFTGKPDAACTSGFAPDSNPTGWHQDPAPPGAVGLPAAPPNAFSRCDDWCDASVHLPGRSPSHCYASSCTKCAFCQDQPGAKPSELAAMSLLDADFDGGQPATPTSATNNVALVAGVAQQAERGRPLLLNLLSVVGAVALVAVVAVPLVPEHVRAHLAAPLLGRSTAEADEMNYVGHYEPATAAGV